MIIAQYYQFLRLGHEGYRRIMVNLTHIATRLQKGIEDTGVFSYSFSIEASLLAVDVPGVCLLFAD